MGLVVKPLRPELGKVDLRLFPAAGLGGGGVPLGLGLGHVGGELLRRGVDPPEAPHFGGREEDKDEEDEDRGGGQDAERPALLLVQELNESFHS